MVHSRASSTSPILTIDCQQSQKRILGLPVSISIRHTMNRAEIGYIISLIHVRVFVSKKLAQAEQSPYTN